MSRYIDVDELRKEVEDSMERNPHESDNLRSNHRVEHKHFMRLICSQPTADVEVVRHAYLCVSFNDAFSERLVIMCSKCGGKIQKKDYYCPHCGAKMDESVKQ